MGSKKKAPKKSLSALQVELTKTEEKLAKARSKSARWKKEAKKQRQSAARAKGRVAKLRKKLKRTASAAELTRSVAEPRGASKVPDETWTVAQLRAEARTRGLVGMSNKPKAHLLAALS